MTEKIKQKIDWKQKYEDLERKSKEDIAGHEIYQNRLIITASRWSRGFDMLMDTGKINNADIKNMLCELEDLRNFKKQVKGKGEYIDWKQKNPDKGFTDYLLELGPFNEVDVDLDEQKQ